MRAAGAHATWCLLLCQQQPAATTSTGSSRVGSSREPDEGRTQADGAPAALLIAVLESILPDANVRGRLKRWMLAVPVSDLVHTVLSTVEALAAGPEPQPPARPLRLLLLSAHPLTTVSSPTAPLLSYAQEEMCFVGDREDSVSMALTVAHRLMEKYGVRPQEIGYLQVRQRYGRVHACLPPAYIVCPGVAVAVMEGCTKAPTRALVQSLRCPLCI